jgi:hypothetical protein
MTQDLLEATLKTISSRAMVEWPPKFKEGYASRRLATEELHTPQTSGLTAASG